MVDKEVKVKVTTEADTSALEDIESALNNLEDKTVTITPEVESMELEEVETRIEELEQKRADIYLGVDDTPLEEVEAELDELEARQIELTVNVDDSSLDEVSGKMDEVESKSSETTDSLNAMGGAVASLGAVAGLDQMITTADNINNSWNRLGLTFGSVTDDLKNNISSAAEATGRAGGTVRGFFNDMGIAGVTNTQLLSQSFEALSGRAYQTGNSIESMEQKMKMMVMSGNAGARQLTALGISAEDLGRAMGVSADEATKMFKNLSQEDRLRVLTQAMGDGKNANDKYKDSLAGMKEQANTAFAGLMGAIGQAILPVIIPAMKALTDIINGVSNAFKGLPGPVKSIVGGFGALVLGAAALFGILSPIGFALKGVYDGFVIAKKGIDLLKDLNAVKTLVSGLQSVASVIRTNVIPSLLEMSAAMLTNPIFLLAAALAILIGYMVWLYSTNEQCRESVNKLGDDLARVAGGDYSALKDVGNDLMGASDSFAQASGFASLIGEENYQKWVELRNGMLQAFGDILGGAGEQLMSFGGLIGGVFGQAISSIQNFGGWVFQTFMQGIMAIQQFGMELLMIPGKIAAAITQAIVQFQLFLGQVRGVLSGIIGAVASFGASIIGQLGSAASNAANSFISGITGLVGSFRAELDGIISDALNFAGELGSAMWNAANQAWQQFLSGLGIHSPGIMQRNYEAEMLGIIQHAKDTEQPLGSAMQSVGESAVNNFDITGLNTPTLPTGGTQAIGGGVTMNIVINGDVDSEERMEKFADYIINRMTFSNDTAGRTI